MGDSEPIKKLHRLLKECDNEHVFMGIIEGIEPADCAPYAARKIIVRTPEGQRVVNFTDPKMSGIDSVAGASFLTHQRTGHSMTVLGKRHDKDGSSTSPLIALLPKNKVTLLTKEPPYSANFSDKQQALLCSIIVILFVISAMSTLFGLLASLVATSFLFAIIGLDRYIQHTRRKIILYGNQKIWKALTEEISESVATIEHNLTTSPS